MAQVVVANCPNCKNSLRIPAEWLGRTMRCKHCHEVFQARGKTPEARPAPVSRAPAESSSPAQTNRSSSGDPFAFDEEGDSNVLPPRRRKRGGAWWKAVVLLFCATGLGAGVFLARPYIADFLKTGEENKVAVDEERNEGNPAGEESAVPENAEQKDPAKQKKRFFPKGKKQKGKAIVAGNLPRRALLINVNNYLYLNSLHYGSPSSPQYPGSSTAAIADRMTRRPLNVPATQVFELSDGGRNAKPTIKAVLEGAISDFLEASREQDRIVLLFAGHAVDIEKDAYLVPLEGDVDDPKTLIPLKWVYEQLAKCRAWQKLLILDVCRYPPARGLEMPAPGEMGEALDAMLQNPPAGVQVWSSCTKGQQSYEFEAGSAFMQSLCDAMKEGVGGIQEPESALPVDTLFAKVTKKMKELLGPEKLEQTTRICGKGPGDAGPFNPKEPLPEPLVIHSPKSPTGNYAGEALVRNILAEIGRIPQVRAMRRGAENLLKMNYLPPFAKSLENYKGDSPTFDELFKMKEDDLEKLDEKYPIRVAVVDAIRVLNKNAEFRMRESLTNPGGPITPAIKNAFLRDQAGPGKAILSLEGALARLKAAGKEREKEFSKRWLAHYDYTLARLEARLVYTFEYDFALASVRTDRLPDLNNSIHNGWRVAASHKVSAAAKEAKVKAYVKDIGKLWRKVMKEYPATPWAVMARRESLTALGLEWHASRD